MRQEAGSVALVTLLATVLLAGAAVAGILAVGIATAAASQARVAADAAALAVLSGSPLTGGSGQPARDAGRVAARANGAELLHIDEGGWPGQVAVVVETPLPPLAWLSGSLRAGATAGLDPPAGP